MPDIKLRVSGKEYKGWTSAIITKSLYQMTGTFGLAGTNLFPGDSKKWGIGMGDECQIYIDNQCLITGYIEDIPISYDNKNHNIQISGRDKTCDLVDCSYAEEPNSWDGQRIIKVIQALCEPFDIDVVVAGSALTRTTMKTTCNSFKSNEGDTVFDSIFRLCQMQGILPVSYGDGKLTLTATGDERAHDSLELGVNIKTGSIDQSNKDRFQTYIVKGQSKKEKNSLKSLWSVDQPEGRSIDSVISRYRPLVILADEKGESADFTRRAQWERNSRAGKSRNIYYEVQGWQQSNGEVWPLNSLVTVRDHFLEINKDLLIAEVKFSIDNDSGSITELTITHPDSVDLPPYDPTDDMSTGFDFVSIEDARKAAAGN